MSDSSIETYYRYRPLSDLAMLAIAAILGYTSIYLAAESDSAYEGILASIVVVLAASALFAPFVDLRNKHPFGKKDVPEAAE
jgi:hypothetical protein